MAIQQLPSNALAADARSLSALKLQAGQDSPAAIKEAAKQFESLFMRELIKSMRDATMKSGLLDSPGGDLGTDLLDQQLAVHLSGTSGGLADVIAKQLSRQMGTAEGKLPTPPEKISRATTAPASVSQAGFVQRHSDVAARVEQSSGIPASFMLGQAGHETGWGRREIRHKDGSASFNLFGIKAGSGWNGKTAEVTTTEYVDGQPRKQVARFRAYDSYEESFRDYARLINESPRYAQARQKTDSSYAFASELKRAGYATDPEYASKLSRAINSTLRLQRAVT
ncbi:MAG TPA: flagellar assembly peptidoglycan hydrolase FlgJ [Burkholderiaceae bacterium]|nr:flagellar assembly peptidoglycan hydrolase FlgJ [Burkholderiaceae bacterium]